MTGTQRRPVHHRPAVAQPGEVSSFAAAAGDAADQDAPRCDRMTVGAPLRWPDHPPPIDAEHRFADFDGDRGWPGAYFEGPSEQAPYGVQRGLRQEQGKEKGRRSV